MLGGVKQLMEIYDFDDKNALNGTEFFILLYQVFFCRHSLRGSEIKFSLN